MQYGWHVFEVRHDIENVAFTVTARPAVVDFHFLVMEKSWKINVGKEEAPCSGVFIIVISAYVLRLLQVGEYLPI